MTKKAQNKSKKKPGLTISSVKKIKLKKSITQIQKIEFWPTLILINKKNTLYIYYYFFLEGRKTKYDGKK